MREHATAGWDESDSILLEVVAREGDSVAYRKLFDRYYARVFVFVQRRLEDRELAREVTSDVFLEVWSNAANFRGESKISTWIFGIARFKCLEAIRRRSRLKRARVVSTRDEVISELPEPRSHGSKLDARQDLRRLAELMQRLPDEQREALEWTVLEGLDIGDVARRQRVSSGTVKTRVSRARRTLRRFLGEDEGVEA